MYLPELDGFTHINVYSKGNTLLGRLLSNFASTPFEHPEDGKFASVEGYWYWLSCRDNRLRDAVGFDAKRLGRELRVPDYCKDEEFIHKICLAIRSKLDQNPGIKTLMKANSLPYAHYYVYKDKVVEPEEGRWVIEYIQSLVP
jgi:hypothetical protein